MGQRIFLPGGRLTRRLFASAVAFPLVAAVSLGFATPAVATSPSLTIGVDNIAPAGENFGFLDYYPRDGIKVHNGDIVGFNFTPPASSDEIHTATLGKPGESVLATFKAYPQGTADTDDSATQGQFPNEIIFPSNPPPQAPGGCGNATNPCIYNGSSEINSGVLCKTPLCLGPSYYYRIALQQDVPTTGLSVHFVCLVHGPVMSGSLTIVPSAQESSSQTELNTRAQTQHAPQNGLGTAAKAVAIAQARASHKVLLGAEADQGHVQVLEMLPNSFNATKGQQVNFAIISQNEIHTATFPNSDVSRLYDPFPAVCETASPPDTAFVPPTSGPPCGDLAKFEVHFNPQPQGATSIATTSTTGTSGVLALFQPFPASSFNFSFPNTGTLTFLCRVHEHMTGKIVVSAPAVPQLAQTGGGREPGSGPVPFGLFFGGLAGLLGLGILGATRLGSIRR